MTRIILNGAGQVDVDLENRVLAPVDMKTAYHLWWMIQCAPRKAVRRMAECEQIASEYAEDDDLGWFWDLPVPPNYRPCPCCVC
jgi:hypothetical protein